MERIASFATMVSTGEKPDAEIHCVAFREEGGLQTIGNLNGGGRDIVMIATSIIKDVVRNLKEKDSDLAAAAFICACGQAFAEAGGHGVMALAALMSSPEAMALDLAKKLGITEEELEEILEDGDD